MAQELIPLGILAPPANPLPHTAPAQPTKLDLEVGSPFASFFMGILTLLVRSSDAIGPRRSLMTSLFL